MYLGTTDLAHSEHQGPQFGFKPTLERPAMSERERREMAAPRHQRGLYNQRRASTHKKNLRVKSPEKSGRHATLPPQPPHTAEDAYNRESDEE
jgi:hypothetical protein